MNKTRLKQKKLWIIIRLLIILSSVFLCFKAKEKWIILTIITASFALFFWIFSDCIKYFRLTKGENINSTLTFKKVAFAIFISDVFRCLFIVWLWFCIATLTHGIIFPLPLLLPPSILLLSSINMSFNNYIWLKTQTKDK